MGEIPRRTAIETLRESVGWLVASPALLAAFIVVDAFGVVAEFTSPILSIVAALIGLFVGGIAYVYADAFLSGESTTIGRAAGPVLDRFISLVGVFIIYLIVVAIGFLLLIIPGIYLGARLILAFPACILDDSGTFDSLSQSWRVAHGNLLKLVGIFLLLFFAMFGYFLLGGLVFGLMHPLFVVLSIPVTAALTGIVELAIARVYLENR